MNEVVQTPKDESDRILDVERIQAAMFENIRRSMAWTTTRSRVIMLVSLIIVVATSITLRKAIPNQTTRMAIGIVEIILLAILASRVFRPREPS